MNDEVKFAFEVSRSSNSSAKSTEPGEKSRRSSNLKNPYRMAAVQRFGERGHERTPAALIAGSEVHRFARKYPAKRGLSKPPRYVTFLMTPARSRRPYILDGEPLDGDPGCLGQFGS
jgi:hypothetical protein